MTCSLLSLQRRVRQETAEELDALRHRWAGPLFVAVLLQHVALCLWFCSSVEGLRAERGALRCAEAELRRRLEAAREVGGHSGSVLLSRACDLLRVMCMQDAACKGRMVVDLETQLACLERKMADEWEVWRRAELTSEREREALQQALSESQSQQQLQVELEGEAVAKRWSTVSLDLDLTREIDHLNKVRSSVPTAFRGWGLSSPLSHIPCQELDHMKEENARLTASLLQQGKALASPLHVSQHMCTSLYCTARSVVCHCRIHLLRRNWSMCHMRR